MTVDHIRAAREAAEARAAERAFRLDPSEDYHASGSDVVLYDPLFERVSSVVQCVSHWDACLVLLALARRRGPAK